MAISIKRYNAETGALLGSISTDPMDLSSEYRLFGGCYESSLRFPGQWTDSPVTSEAEELVIESNNVPVFAGRVTKVKPSLQDGSQNVTLQGWWKRLDEIAVVTDPKTDRITFGVSDNSDFPALKTAYDVVDWLITNRIVADAKSPITRGTVTSPTYSCKLGEFAIYAGDKLTKVLEDLATMDDCVVGIDADRKFYYIPRSTLVATVAKQIRVYEDVPANWRNSKKLFATSGDFTTERQGPNTLQIHSRDIQAREGIRTYRYATALSGSQRYAVYYAPNVRRGQGARRLARGLFRRFAKFATKVENLECFGGTDRYEPHLGAFAVYNNSSLLTTDLAGSVRVAWLSATGTVTVTVTLGENKPDPGGGNPINDPFSPIIAMAPPDNPQIDTGDTEEGVSIASIDIDEDDGFDGDGDDLHQNADRDEPSDPAGGGVTPVDYGDDEVDETNLTAPPFKALKPGIVVSYDSGSNTASVNEISTADFSTVVASHTGVRVFPETELEVDQEVWLVYDNGTLGSASP